MSNSIKNIKSVFVADTRTQKKLTEWEGKADTSSLGIIKVLFDEGVTDWKAFGKVWVKWFKDETIIKKKKAVVSVAKKGINMGLNPYEYESYSKWRDACYPKKDTPSALDRAVKACNNGDFSVQDFLKAMGVEV